jgi:hypothetical protein
MKKLTAAIALLASLYSPLSNAGTAINSTVGWLHFMSDGLVLVYIFTGRADTPACATQPTRFAFNATTPGGKVQLAGLLTAYAAGKRVNIIGTGNCTLFADSETLSYFMTVDS